MTFTSFSEPFIRRPVGTTLLAIGLLTRPAALAGFIFMMVAGFSTHLPNGFF